jgi:hypothetical protein
MHNRRTRYLVDGNLQWRLTRRAVATWLVGGLMVFTFPVAISFMYGVFIDGLPAATVARNLYQAYWFPFLLALLVVPIGIRDSFRFSNRIAGPMMRLKRNMADLAAGHQVRPIYLRPGDFFNDAVDSFNRLVQDYQHLQELITRGGVAADAKAEYIAAQAARALQNVPGAPAADPRKTAPTNAVPAASALASPATIPTVEGQPPWMPTSQNSVGA